MYIKDYKMYFLKKMKIRNVIIKLILCYLLVTPLLADEKGPGLKFYTGTFDFSDEGARSQ